MNLNLKNCLSKRVSRQQWFLSQLGRTLSGLEMDGHSGFGLHSTFCLCSRVKKKENDKDEDVKEEERELKDRRCFQCGDPGHVRRDCPEYRHLKQRAAAASGVPQHSGKHSLFLCSRPPMTQGSLSGSSPAHVIRNMGASQSLPIPQAPADGPGRTRQSSECVSKEVLIPTAVNVQP